VTTDVTDATFRDEVMTVSDEVPVVVDLWAPWCGPCGTLGPILEKVVDATDGAVRLVKINIDENPRAANTFAVQSIPAVFAVSKGRVVDQFIGAIPERDVRAFVERLIPAKTEADLLVEQGGEESLRKALALDPDHEGAVLGLATLLTERARPGDTDEALSLLARLPETAEVRRAAAQARLAATTEAAAGNGAPSSADLDARLDGLLDKAKEDGEARQELLDVLETMDAEDPRRTRYRKALAARLF
jgi:putative thioredoxin